MWLTLKWCSKLHVVHRADRTADFCSISAADFSSCRVGSAAAGWEGKVDSSKSTVMDDRGV